MMNAYNFFVHPRVRTFPVPYRSKEFVINSLRIELTFVSLEDLSLVCCEIEIRRSRSMISVY